MITHIHAAGVYNMHNFKLTYGIEPTQPKSISLWVKEGFNFAEPATPAYDYNAQFAGTAFRNAYEFCSAIAQTFSFYQATGVQWYDAVVTVTDNSDPDIVLSTFIQPVDALLGTGFVGIGISNRVMGLKCKTNQSGRASILAAGYMNDATAGYNNGNRLDIVAQLTRLNNLRTSLNALQRSAPTAVDNVQRTFTILTDYPNKLYHGVRRA